MKEIGYIKKFLFAFVILSSVTIGSATNSFSVTCDPDEIFDSVQNKCVPNPTGGTGGTGGNVTPPVICDPDEIFDSVQNKCVPNPTDKQILINNNIQSVESFGKYNDTEYTDVYNVRNLFDNLTNTWSFWSQYGKSGFVVHLQNPLDKPVCSIQIGIFNPQNTSFNLKIGNVQNLKDFNGILDEASKKVDIVDCIKDVSEISMNFDADKKWTTLSEVKLYTNSSVIIPPPEPIVCPDGYHYDKVQKKCLPDVVTPIQSNFSEIIISNGTAIMNITNSKIIMNIDETNTIVEPLTE